MEYRSFDASGMSADSGRIHGLAAPFNTPTDIRDKQGEYRESFLPGAFTDSLANRDVVFLVGHDSSKPVARLSAGSLDIRQTERGLEFTAVPNKTTYARDLVENIRSGAINGTSFGFMATDESWMDDGGNEVSPLYATRRVVRSAQLDEISAVTFPAYPDTELSARSASAAKTRRMIDPVAELERLNDMRIAWSLGLSYETFRQRV